MSDGVSNEVVLAVGGGGASIIFGLLGVIWGLLSQRITKLERDSQAQDSVDRQQAESIAKLEERSNNIQTNLLSHQTNVAASFQTVMDAIAKLDVKIDRIMGYRSFSPPPK
jgi:formiminotetrahydrofolate cyclodeaminase